MATRIIHDSSHQCFYFVTFTCIKWKWLFDLANGYDAVYSWFNYLYNRGSRVTGYVIMPNHLHVLLYFREMHQPLNTIIGNGKRFMAYDIIKRLESTNQMLLLEELYGFVTCCERKKNQRHKVFEDGFDAKECYTRNFIQQKLNYMHHNPIAKGWNLVYDYTDYMHSSASYYEKGIIRYDKLAHVAEVW